MKFRLLSILLFIAPFISFSQSYYDNTFDFGHYDHPEAMVTDNVGNIIVCGWSESDNFEDPRAFALKVDLDGQEVWRFVIEETSKLHSLCILESGEIAFAGSIGDNSFIRLVDAEMGNEIWSYADNESDGYWFGTVTELTGGVKKHLNAVKTTEGFYAPIVYVFDSGNGDILEQYLYHHDFYNPIEHSYKQAYNYMWFAAKEVLVATDYYGEFPVIWTFSASYIAGIDRYSPDAFCVVRIWNDSNLTIALLTWDFISGGVYGNSIDLYHENAEALGSGVLGFEKILVTGNIDDDLALWLIGNDLNLLDEITYPNTNSRTGIDVVGLPTNDLVIMGNESINDGSASDVFLMKRDANGGVVSTPELTTDSDIQVFPNPATNRIFIKNANNLDVEVDIMNSLGQIVKKISKTNQYLSIEDLQAGYYVAIVKSDGVITGQKKLIIQ
tara:strand:+ start:788 stop:2113 length:1326 start_codon:yes stop_codon:yes gene_type:complete